MVESFTNSAARSIQNQTGRSCSYTADSLQFGDGYGSIRSKRREERVHLWRIGKRQSRSEMRVGSARPAYLSTHPLLTRATVASTSWKTSLTSLDCAADNAACRRCHDTGADRRRDCSAPGWVSRLSGAPYADEWGGGHGVYIFILGSDRVRRVPCRPWV